MTRLITDDLFLYKMSQREEDNEPEHTFGQVKIDIYKLITLGVMLCWGTHQLKARVLYGVIYSTIQEFVVPNDRMEAVFRNLIVFSTILMQKHACKDA